MVDLGTIRGRVVLDIKQAVASYAALRANNARLVYALRGTGDAFTSSGRSMVVAGGAMVYAFGKVVNAAAQFERKMDFAAAVSGTTGKQMQRLSDYALKLGQDTIYSAGEVADGFIELAKAGVSATDIIHGIGKAMTSLGAAGDIPLQESGQIITSTIQQFDLASRDAIKVTDLLAGAANASIADITDIGVSLKYVGGVANAAGLSLEDTTTAISLLAKAGIRGSTAGTSLRQMIVSLGGATGPAYAALQELGIITEDGSNKFYDAQGNTKSLSEVFQILQNHTEKLTNKQRLMYLRTIFNNRALSAASILTRDGAKGFREMNKEMSKTTAAEVARKRLDNLSGDIEILRGNIETLMIKAGSPFQEQLRGWVQGLTKLIQAYADLDPKTQRMITQTIAASGATLLALGAFNLIIGSIFKFVANMIKLAAGWKFFFKILKIVLVNLKWVGIIMGGELVAAIGALSATVIAIIAVILALVIAFVIAYKKSAKFREIVNAIAEAIWDATKAVGRFLELLAKDPGAAWDKVKNGASQLADYLIKWFTTKLPELIRSGVEKAAQYVLDFVTSVLEYLSKLPGQALGLLGDFVSKVISLLTFQNLGTVFGTVVGFIIQGFVRLQLLALQAITGLVTGMVSLLAGLAPKVGYAIGFMIGWVLRQMIQWNVKMMSLIARMVSGIIGWVARLPGRIAGFIGRMVVGAIKLAQRMAVSLPALASRAAKGIVNFFRNLPANVARLFQALFDRARNILSKLPGIARQFATGARNGLLRSLENLPGLVAGIVGKCISAFEDAISQAFNAAKGFAGGLWDGFKDGLGINSPSLIEKQMVQMTQVIDDETGKMKKQTLGIQKMSKTLVKSQLAHDKKSIVPQGAAGIHDLAMMHARNQKRTRTLASASSSSSRGARPHRSPNAKRRGPVAINGNLKMTNSGAYIEGYAQGLDYDEDDYEDTLERMR